MENSTHGPSPSRPAARPPGLDEAKLARAKRRVAALKGFYIHLLVFALALAGLFLINLLSGGPWWVLWVLIGWGIGVIAHALTVFGRGSQLVAAWEERKLKQFMDER
jgi:hypothetical protein